jgi:5'-nucleotidase
MRIPNDVKLAEADSEIDLILGGHDHVYDVREINGKHVIKSGTDFRQFSRITLRFESSGHRPDVSVERVDVTSQYIPDLGLQEQLDKYAGETQLIYELSLNH